MSKIMLMQVAAVLVAAVLGFTWIQAMNKETSLKEKIGFFDEPDKPQMLADVEFMNQMADLARFSDFRGKVILVNLWATWCPPCVKELPSLDALQEKLGGSDFEVVAVAVEQADLAKIADFYRTHGITHLKVFLDNKRAIPAKISYAGLPTTFLIDRQGRQIGRYDGPAEWDSPEAITAIKAAIAR